MMTPGQVRFPHGPLDGNQVLSDLMRDNQRRVLRLLDRVDDACFRWRPDPGANDMALTLWHIARLTDVFLTRFVQKQDAAAECWMVHGWAETTGYDPHGLGLDGWGTLNDYTPDEIAAMPVFTRAQLVTYLGQVCDAVDAFLAATPMQALTEQAAGFDGQFTRYQCLTMALMDNVRHMGEMAAIKAMWDRRAGPS
jgi:hypothetical protein